MSILLTVLQSIISLFLFIILYLSAGLGFLGLIKKDWQISLLGKSLLAIFFSFALYGSSFFILGSLIGPKIFYLNYLFFIWGIININKLQEIFKNLKKYIFKNKILSAFTVLCILSMYLTIAFSGLSFSGDLVFQPGQLHDGIWHVALIKNLKQNIPPIHPASFNYDLKNYHYFYDLILASFAKSFNLDVFVLYFQVFPLILSSLLALAAIYLAQTLKKRNLAYLLLFFTFFVGSFAQFIPYFVPNQAWNDASFWVSQTFTMIVNPQLIFSLALLYFVIALLQASLKFKKQSLVFFGVIAFLIASSVGFKSYGFVVMSVLYASFLGLNLLIKKSKVYLLALIKFLVLGFIYFIFTNDIGKSVFFYQPFWYTTSMIESPDRVNYPLWKILEQHYILHQNWLRVYEIWVKEFLIFFFGNLGTRSLAIFLPLVYLFKKKVPSILEISIFLSFLFASFFPLFFLQRGIVWNSIQFWYYALILANVFASLLFYKIFKQVNKAIAAVILVLLLVLSLPTYLKSLKPKFTKQDIITQEELNFFNQLSTTDRVLVCPSDGIVFKTSAIEALTQASVYFANPVQLLLVGEPAQEMEIKLKEMFTLNKFGDLEKIVQDNKISHLACQKKDWLKMFDNKSQELITINDWQIRKIK